MPGTNPGTTNLVSWWALDEASGTRADSHGSQNLTDNNTVTTATAKVGANAAQFTRANSESLSRADEAAISFGDEDFSFGGWVYLDSLGSGIEVRCLMAKGTLAGDTTSEFAVYYNFGVSRFRAFVRGPTALGVLNADNLGAPSAGTWYFLVVVHDSVGNTVKFYANAGTPDSVAHTDGCRNGSEALFIGAATDAARFLDGRGDECFLYRQVLTADHVTWLYNGGAGRSYASLTATGSLLRVMTEGLYVGSAM